MTQTVRSARVGKPRTGNRILYPHETLKLSKGFVKCKSRVRREHISFFFLPGGRQTYNLSRCLTVIGSSPPRGEKRDFTASVRCQRGPLDAVPSSQEKELVLLLSPSAEALRSCVPLITPQLRRPPSSTKDVGSLPWPGEGLTADPCDF